MATQSENNSLKELRAENERIRRENRELKQRLSEQPPKGGRSTQEKGPLWRKIVVGASIVLAVALLVAGNLLFWAGNTVVKTDRFTEAVAPIIRDKEVQRALSDRISNRLFTNVDVEQTIVDLFPPRLDFTAPAIASQVETQTDNAILKVLERPQFQDRWDSGLERAHSRFISSVDQNGSDGAIDISEIYSGASEQLKGTKLAFLADKPLPAKVGNIQLVQGDWISRLQRVIQNIDLWRSIAIGLLLIFSVLGVWLSQNRRRTVIRLAGFWAIFMFLTAVSIRIAREMLAGQVDPAYAEAVRNAYSIFVRPLAIQTFTLMGLALAVALVAWISGTSRSARAVKGRLQQLLNGKLHEAIFSKGENGFTLWMGRHKRLLQWLTVGLVAVSALFLQLTLGVLFWQLVIIFVVIVVIEILAATPERGPRSRVA